MIQLRNLKLKDAPRMLAWMHDEQIADFFEKDMAGMALEDTKRFCAEYEKDVSIKDGVSLHFAVVDSADDAYQGTVSLKNMDIANRAAEYAISIRKEFHGTGTAREATKLLLKKGFEEYGLHRIYLNVLAVNQRAVRFYEKCGFQYEGESREGICKKGQFCNLKWYSMLEDEYKREVLQDEYKRNG